jgi:prepilin-type N-terminal cleavage/methylation domain-containing protein
MRRGFTLLELAICLAVSATLVPLLFTFSRAVENDFAMALADAESSSQMRSFSEELRRDLMSMRVVDGPGLVLQSVRPGACARVEYVAVEETLMRRADDACGGERAIAARLSALHRDGRSVTLEFARPVRPDLRSRVAYRLSW